jgi:type II secretory ATPase GspE/PulE/Tfp pilus assembly ATPase PilB-like protein
MKLNTLHEELIELAKSLNINVRKEKGNFRSGYCIVNDKEVLIINKSTPLESLNSIIAQGMAKHTQDIHIKPAVREFIERELKNYADKNSIDLEIEY